MSNRWGARKVGQKDLAKHEFERLARRKRDLADLAGGLGACRYAFRGQLAQWAMAQMRATARNVRKKTSQAR
jgi:hypothetical protein